jgi:hypothetical protein
MLIILGMLAECHYVSDLPNAVTAFTSFFEASPILDLVAILLAQNIDEPSLQHGLSAFAMFGECYRSGKLALTQKLKEANYLDSAEPHENKFFVKCHNIKCMQTECVDVGKKQKPNFKACPTCGIARYCSSKCQMYHYKVGGHKEECRK